MARRVEERVVVSARSNLAAALPKGHPVQKEVDALIEAMWGELGDADVALTASKHDTVKATHTIEAHATLIDVLEDWRRGVRDWSEVEDALKRAGLARTDQEDPA